MGIGFAGGVWHGGVFAYNTAVVHVNTTIIHNTYVDNTIVHNTTVINNTHVAYSGGPGGINHPPTAQENAYSREPHQAATSFQTQHQTEAMHNPANFASHNGGHPANAAVARPMGMKAGSHAAAGSQSHVSQPHAAPQQHPAPQQHASQPHGGGQPHNESEHGHEHGH